MSMLCWLRWDDKNVCKVATLLYILCAHSNLCIHALARCIYLRSYFPVYKMAHITVLILWFYTVQQHIDKWGLDMLCCTAWFHILSTDLTGFAHSKMFLGSQWVLRSPELEESPPQTDGNVQFLFGLDVISKAGNFSKRAQWQECTKHKFFCISFLWITSLVDTWEGWMDILFK